MNRILVFFLGFVAGIVAAFLTLIVIGVSVIGDRHFDFEDFTEDTACVEAAVEETVVVEEAVQSDSIEVKGRNGYVNLAVGMSKDEVKARLGRPKTTDYRYGQETWRYEFPGEGMYGTVRVMMIEFRNGDLVSINQY